MDDREPNALANGEISLLDVADILYDKIAYVIGGLVVGIALAVWAFFLQDATQGGQRLTVTVYSAGTPSHRGQEVAEQMKFALIRSGVFNVRQDATSLDVRLESDQDIHRVNAALQEVAAKIDDQVGTTFRYLDNMDPEAKDAAIVQVYHAYVTGRELGLISLYEVGQSEAQTHTRSLRLPIMGLAFGLLLGFSLAILSKFGEAWIARRRARAP
jgi:hypothetical protein